MMKKSLVFILFLFISVALSSDDPSDAVISRLEKTVALQQQQIERAEKYIYRLKSELAEKDAEILRLRSLCRDAGIDIKNTSNLSDPNISDLNRPARIQVPLQVGQVVYFAGDDKFKVQQIIDQQNMIVELWITETVRFRNGWLNDSRKLPVLIRGFNTSKYADGTIIQPDPNQLFEITGNQSYDTLFTGIKTYFVLEPAEKNESR